MTLNKLTPLHLRLGLRPMDILTEVVNRPTQRTAEDPDALFCAVEQAER
jgi:hypothetical protein